MQEKAANACTLLQSRLNTRRLGQVLPVRYAAHGLPTGSLKLRDKRSSAELPRWMILHLLHDSRCGSRMFRTRLLVWVPFSEKLPL